MKNQAITIRSLKEGLKDALGTLPLTVELYRALSRQPVKTLYKLPNLEQNLANWAAEVQAVRAAPGSQLPLAGRKVALFGYLPYWLEHETLMGLALAGLGCEVRMLYWPHHKYNRGDKLFDVRNQNLYLAKLLAPAARLLNPVSLLSQPLLPLPDKIQTALEQTTRRDAQYILQVEEISTQTDLYQMRWQRNKEAARRALGWFSRWKPDTIIIPNGAILEFEAIYLAARHAGVSTVTYEFSELSQRIWLAQNADVMQQNTDDLWAARRDQPLTTAQTEALRTMYAARQRPLTDPGMVFRYQGAEPSGGDALRRRLGLDDRPLLLIPANVIGDSVTLGRQVFSHSMTDWLERTLLHLTNRPHVQLVVRVHPGEALTQGPSVAAVVERVFPNGLPAHIHLVRADDPVNTYDLVEIADAGLVYTTTVGLEMALNARPVIVVGQAHYRGRGFTLDPQTWDEYFALLDNLTPTRPPAQQTSLAWNYAYRYFFEFPRPFPWHLYHLPQDLEEWPLKRVLSPEGQQRFGQTLRWLAGEPVNWDSTT